MGTANGRVSGGRRVFGRVMLGLLGLAFLVAGGWAGWGVASIAQEFWRGWNWEETRCRIVSSRVAIMDDPRSVAEGGVERPDGSLDGSAKRYRFLVDYGYEVDGRELRSRVPRVGYEGSDSIGPAQRWRRRFPFGATVPCFVDPEDPESAALLRPSPTRLLWILAPAVLLLLGGFLGWLAARPRLGPVRGGQASVKAISRAGSSAEPAGRAAGCFGLMLAVGLIALWFAFVRPMMRWVDSKGWDERPCRVLSSEVERHDSDDGATFSVDVLFEYEVEGEAWQSDRYDFSFGSSSGYQAKKEIVDRYPSGSEWRCFVDPQDPSRAVIDRGFSPVLLIGLVPLVFVLIGGVGLLVSGSSAFPSRRGRSPIPRPPGPGFGVDAAGEGPCHLEVQQSPVGKFFGILVFGLVWNGFLAGVGYLMWRDAGGDWSGMGCVGAFLLPFGLVGLLLFLSLPSLFLAIFNPRPRLQLSSGRLWPGRELELQWTFSGKPARIQHLKIQLRGREEATYRRGTDSHTAKEDFVEATLLDTGDSTRIASGSLAFAIPADSVPSFEASDNRIVWTLRVEGDVPRWPDVEVEFEVEVGPIPREELARQERDRR